jgi:hypothetical protein
MQKKQFTPSRPFDGLKPPNPAVIKEQRGIGTPKRPDQTPAYDVPGVMSSVIDAPGHHPRMGISGTFAKPGMISP